MVHLTKDVYLILEFLGTFRPHQVLGKLGNQLGVDTFHFHVGEKGGGKSGFAGSGPTE